MESKREEELKNLAEKLKKMPYSEFVEVVKNLTEEEILLVSSTIGYPVFIRLCMGELAHIIPILQDGAAAIILDEDGRILLQSRADRNKWGLPGGCQEAGESFEEVIVREVKEETDLDVNIEDLEYICTVSGESRRNSYPTGDVVFNNTALYCVRKYSGKLKWNQESKEMRFFDEKHLPENQNDPDVIEFYKKWVMCKERK